MVRVDKVPVCVEIQLSQMAVQGFDIQIKFKCPETRLRTKSREEVAKPKFKIQGKLELDSDFLLDSSAMLIHDD
jgi:hypothetical protein